MATRAILRRFLDLNGAMVGILTIPEFNFRCYTLEDAWRDNRQMVSCIPTGLYEVVPHGWEKDSKPRFKRSYRLLDVPNRSAILIHTGNTDKDTHGCILVGHELKLGERNMILEASEQAMNQIRSLLPQQGFQLEVVGI